jgi:large conductance mechanosensitive channel
MSVLTEFKKFALRGNVIDMAIGFTVGAAFTTIARSLVDDIIMPPVGLLMGGADFSDLFVVLKEGNAPLSPAATLQEATELGAVTLNYGRFINNVVAFLLVALAMFLILRSISGLEKRLERDRGRKQGDAPPEDPENKKCPYCLSTINFLATRCPQCTSELEST